MNRDFNDGYEEGDLVEIITPDEYRERGGSCSDDCAIARFCGSICEVVRHTIPGVCISPIKLVEHFPPKYPDDSIESYSWQYMSIKRYKGDVESESAVAFDSVFA